MVSSLKREQDSELKLPLFPRIARNESMQKAVRSQRKPMLVRVLMIACVSVDTPNFKFRNQPRNM